MDYSKLRGKIREVFGTQKAFAAEMGMDVATVSAKLNGRYEWSRCEMEKTCKILGIPMSEMHLYFFCPIN